MSLLQRVFGAVRGPQPPAPKAAKPRQALPETTILGLRPEQIYPTAEYLTPEFFRIVQHGLLTRETPIGSMGSCFAREVKNYLVQRGFSYIQAAQGHSARHGSASWPRKPPSWPG